MEQRTQEAGGIVVRDRGKNPSVLLVQARGEPRAWIFPKGHVEPGESREEAALRECREEGGVDGRIVRPLASRQMTSGQEPLEVHYFLVDQTGDVPTREREVVWLSPLEAIAKLTHEDARTLLIEALPELGVPTPAGAEGARPDDDAFHDFLCAEYDHTADSFLRNEEDGERRVNTYLAVVGGLAAALTFTTGDQGLFKASSLSATVAALALMLAFGIITMLRVVRRNKDADDYKRRLARIRRYFVPTKHDARFPLLAFDPFDAPRTRDPFRFWTGGWFEIVALLNALTAAALAAVVAHRFYAAWRPVVAIAAVAGAGAWYTFNCVAIRLYRAPESPSKDRAAGASGRCRRR